MFNLSKETDVISGAWTTNVVPLSGECCHLDLTLVSEEGTVTGGGVVETPGSRIGSSQEFSIGVTGTIIRDRVNLSLASENNPGKIEGVVIRNYSREFDIVLRVNFEGFGYKGRDIILFRRRS